ncbi:hypothetical protein [uncultured Parabacteroides sp.]|uniref:hypothetical protein n=1 Tax=uncultured Parabacteroides sp. TaxID=512312 RepID=UPI00259256D1|nr:hypothetical protein [uncultured Parabacteroides sp.]
MGYTIPQNCMDEEMKYALKLYDKLCWYDGEYFDNGWLMLFHSRLVIDAIKPPFKYEAFLDNKDIIATIEGYELDVEKFWFALLFIYDITKDFGINAADASKSDYDVLVEIDDYLQNHPQAVLYLSDDKELRKSERYETNSPVILVNLRRFVKRELEKYEEPPQLKVWTHDIMCRNYTESLGAAQQQVLMYKLFKVLFDVLGLPDLRAERGSIVSYSKLLLISRIIHFCRLSRKEVFLVSDSALKGNIKQYGDFDFNQRRPKNYMGGLKLPKDEGE